MLDIKRIRNDTEAVRQGLANTGADAAIIDKILNLDEQRRVLQKEGDRLRAEMNALSKNIGQEKNPDRKKELISGVGDLKKQIKQNESEVPDVENLFSELMLSIPNVPLAEVTVGSDESNNEISAVHGGELGAPF